MRSYSNPSAHVVVGDMCMVWRPVRDRSETQRWEWLGGSQTKHCSALPHYCTHFCQSSTPALLLEHVWWTAALPEWILYRVSESLSYMTTWIKKKCISYCILCSVWLCIKKKKSLQMTCKTLSHTGRFSSCYFALTLFMSFLTFVFAILAVGSECSTQPCFLFHVSWLNVKV